MNKKITCLYCLIILLLIFSAFTGCEYPAELETGNTPQNTFPVTENAAADQQLSGPAETRGTSKKIVAIVWDGFKNEKRIDKAFYSAMRNVSGWSAWRKYWLSGSYDIGDTKNRINDLVSAYGIPKSMLTCLVIGK